MEKYFISCISSGGTVYALYRRIVDGRGVWAAQEMKAGAPAGDPFPITYEQARGISPIRKTAASSLAVILGRALLPARAVRR